MPLNHTHWSFKSLELNLSYDKTVSGFWTANAGPFHAPFPSDSLSPSVDFIMYADKLCKYVRFNVLGFALIKHVFYSVAGVRSEFDCLTRQTQPGSKTSNTSTWSSITNHTSKGLSSFWLHLSFHSFQSLPGPGGTVSALWDGQSTDHFLLKVIIKSTGLRRTASPWKTGLQHWHSLIESTKWLQLKSAGVQLKDFVNSPETEHNRDL